VARSRKVSDPAAAPLYESKDAPLLPRPAFALRLVRHALIATVLIVVSLAIGTIGYHAIAALRWIDAFENAAMILTGMGPVSPMPNDGAKLFAAGYALFSGTAFLTGVAVMVAPLAHRLLHRFHLEDDDRNEG
jgi:hypothetical protein